MSEQKGSPRFGEAGQILLIVILVVIVASTIGLSVASRSITSIRTSIEEAEYKKALAAAEAGIERAIQSNAISTGLNILNDSLANESRYAVDIEQGDSSRFLINGGNAIPKDEGADVWFVNHNSDGSLNFSDYFSTSPNFLNLYWGTSSDGCNEAAVQAIVVTGEEPVVPNTTPTNVKSYRYVYDACSGRRTGDEGNNFTLANVEDFTIGGVTFKYRTPLNDLTKDITPASKKDIILMRVIPVYKDAVIGIYACNNGEKNCTSLPSQGYKITSTGTSGQATSRLTFFKGNPQTYLPYLSYGLFVAN